MRGSVCAVCVSYGACVGQRGVDVVILRCRNLSPPKPLYYSLDLSLFASGALSDRRVAVSPPNRGCRSG